MPKMSRLLNELYVSPGYSRALSLAPSELSDLRAMINDGFRRRLSEFMDVPDDLTADRYHELAITNHSAMWTKAARFLPQEAVDRIREFDFLKLVERELGPFEISRRITEDGCQSDGAEIYWRLVRPGEKTDVGPLHADIWFADALDYHDRLLERCTTAKVWIPVYVEPDCNGLLVVDDSHTRSWEYDIVMTETGRKPRIRSAVDSVMVPTSPGEILLFGENLLHGGSFNAGTRCRVSVEITLIFATNITAGIPEAYQVAASA